MPEYIKPILLPGGHYKVEKKENPNKRGDGNGSMSLKISGKKDDEMMSSEVFYPDA
jgi:hypothetical protein